MDEAKRCHSSRLQNRLQNLACLGYPTRRPNTPQYCMKLQPSGVGRGWQVEEANKGHC